MGELTKRIISAILFAIIVFGSILYGYWGLYLLFGIVIIGSYYEYMRIGFGETNNVVLFFAVVPYFIYGIFGDLNDFSLLLIISLISSVLILLIGLLFQPKRGFEKSNFGLAGIIYLVIPISMILYISMWSGEYSAYLILAIIVLNWVNDTFAYFTGRLIGKTPLFPRISPKKTIEGSIGGLVFTIIAAFFIGKEIPLEGVNWVILGLIIIVFGSLGDLVESMFKRFFKVKDSGKIMPGHGGFLDRFDSLILILPIVAFYFYMLKIL